jgi:hypothetical protein
MTACLSSFMLNVNTLSINIRVVSGNWNETVIG